MNPAMVPERKPILTLKRVIVCTTIGMAAMFPVTWFIKYRDTTLSTRCIASMRNLNAALVLYRADWDGYSPAYSVNHQASVDKALMVYSKGKPVACPSRGELSDLRVSNGHKETPDYIPFGIEDNSVISGPCNYHLNYRTIVGLRGGWPDSWSESSGKSHLLLRSGTVKLVSQEVESFTWHVKNSKFSTVMPSSASWSSYDHVYLYDFEPKPPEFEY